MQFATNERSFGLVRTTIRIILTVCIVFEWLLYPPLGRWLDLEIFFFADTLIELRRFNFQLNGKRRSVSMVLTLPRSLQYIRIVFDWSTLCIIIIIFFVRCYYCY